MNATQSTAPRQRKPRSKPARSIRLCIRPEGEAPGVVKITLGKKADDYFITRLATDFGKGFLLEKIGLETTEGKYAVNIDTDKRSCECKGFLHHGHCKHADGIAALIARSQL